VLRDQLPSKDEHVILVRLSPIQRALYTEFMKRFREAGNSGWLGLNPLKAFCVCCKVRLFPWLLRWKPLVLKGQNNLFSDDTFDESNFGSNFDQVRLLLLPVRFGITQMSSMKPCRRRIRPTSRTLTSMASLQLVTPAVLTLLA